MNRAVQKAVAEFAGYPFSEVEREQAVASVMRAYVVTIVADGKAMEQLRVLAVNPCDANVTAMSLLYGDFDAVHPTRLKITVEPVGRRNA